MANNTNQQQNCNVFKLCTINIDGLSDKSKFSLNKYIHDEKFDTISILETGTSDTSKLELDNMTMICDTNNASNRGAALYARDKYSITKLESLSRVSNHIDSCWGLIIKNNRRYIMGSVYVKLNYNSAIKDVINMLNAAKAKQKELKAYGVILTGDFNARHMSWGDSQNNTYGKQLAELLDPSVYSICISKTPTFLCVNGGSSFIDFSIVTNEIADSVINCKTDEGVYLCSGAPKRGHVPVITEFQTNSASNSEQIKTKLDISKMNWAEWTEYIEKEIDKNKNDPNTNPYAIWNRLNQIITKATSIYGATKRCCSYSKPFWTNTLTILSNELRQARKCYIKRNTERNMLKLDEAKDAFDTERKKVCNDFLLDKTKSLNSVQAQHFWKEFKKIFQKKTIQRIDPLDNGKNGLITEHREMEKCLFSVFFEAKHLTTENFDNTFYQQVNGIYEDIIKGKTPEVEEDQDLYNLNRNVKIEEIKKAIKSSGTSVDDNNFHPVMFRHLGAKALTTLQELFNQCLFQHIWVWESANVIFLRKPGKDSYSKPGAYRPICITSYIGKLLESIIANRIEILMIAIDKTDPDQEGFSKFKNTIRYLNRLHLGIKVDQENYLTVLCLFVDFEKAFDSVWKKGLITKLYNIGVRGNVLNLINNFLITRKVKLNINGFEGNQRQSADYGLPQGSVLSPVLFKIFVSDFISELNNRKDIVIYKFADDGTIKVTAKDSPTCLATMNHVLKILHAWTRKWRMKINCDRNKTEIICFNTSENNINLIPNQFKLGNETIQRVAQTKVLGLTIDEKLTYKSHSQAVLKRLHEVWSTLCKYASRNWGFNQQVMLYLVKTLFLSVVSYASHIWMDDENIKEINKLWYHIIKSIIGAVFNVKQIIAEVILGVPPLLIQSKANGIKHLLKLNFNNVPNDRYKEFLSTTYKDMHVKSTIIEKKFKEVYRFLHWKYESFPSHFTESDYAIIAQDNYSRFFELTAKACGYTQPMMNKYIENTFWNKSLKMQFQLEGYHDYPRASCMPLPIPKYTNRNKEVILMSLLYKNNLLNSFLYTVDRVPSPMCSLCNCEEETPDHILFRCSRVQDDLRQNVVHQYRLATNDDDDTVVDFIDLLNVSRHENFISSCVNLLNSVALREDIIL